MTKSRICVGAIMGAFGTRGEVRLKSFTAEPADVATYAPITSEDGTQEYTIKITRPVKGGFAARVGGVRYRDEAEALRGVRLFVPREALPSLPDDEFYHSDLMGLDVFDTGGAKIGKVKAVQDFGATDILEVQRPGAPDVLVPFTAEVVPTVDLTARRLILDPPEGLLD